MRRFEGFLVVEVLTAALVVCIGLGVLVDLCRQSARADARAVERAASELRLHGWLEVVVAQPYAVLAGWAARGGVVTPDDAEMECEVSVRAVSDGLLEVRVELPGRELVAARLVARCDLGGEASNDAVLP